VVAGSSSVDLRSTEVPFLALALFAHHDLFSAQRPGGVRVLQEGAAFLVIYFVQHSFLSRRLKQLEALVERFGRDGPENSSSP
jgi:hypothetical protein